MSLIGLIGFIMTITGDISPELFTDDVMTQWALFSIADALWIRLLKK